jgi:hypothetical protein
MTTRADEIHLTEAIDRLRAERDRLNLLIDRVGPVPELVAERDQVEDLLIGTLQTRRRRMREAVPA